MIVNGVVDSDLGVPRDLLEQAAVTVCRLRADRDEVVRRLTARRPGGDGDAGNLARQVRAECDRMDASAWADVSVDTTGVAAAEVARLVRDRCRGWPGFGMAAEPSGAAPAGPASGPAQAPGARVLLLCGPTGVGKSTIGFQLYLRGLAAGRTAGYLDLDQIGFLRPGPPSDPRNHELKARNLAGNLAGLPRGRGQSSGAVRSGRQPGRARYLRGRAARRRDHGVPPARRAR